MENKQEEKIYQVIFHPELNKEVDSLIQVCQKLYRLTNKRKLDKELPVLEQYRKLNTWLKERWAAYLAVERIDLMERNVFDFTAESTEWLDKARQAKSTVATVEFCHQLCLIYILRGDLEIAKKFQKECEKLIITDFPSTKFFTALTYHFHDLGIAHAKRGSNTSAAKYLKKALSRYETFAIETDKNMAHCRFMIGNVSRASKIATIPVIGNMEVKSQYELSMKSLKGDTSYETLYAEMAIVLGEVYSSAKKWKAAEEKYQEALQIFHQKKNRPFLKTCYEALGNIKKKQKLNEEAASYFEKANYYKVLAENFKSMIFSSAEEDSSKLSRRHSLGGNSEEQPHLSLKRSSTQLDE